MIRITTWNLLYHHFKIWSFWSASEFSQGWNNEIVASGSGRTMEYRFFLLGSFPIQKFRVKMNFFDNLVMLKLETHYPNLAAVANLTEYRKIDEF